MKLAYLHDHLDLLRPGLGLLVVEDDLVRHAQVVALVLALDRVDHALAIHPAERGATYLRPRHEDLNSVV
jgi:hypothetical protein